MKEELTLLFSAVEKSLCHVIMKKCHSGTCPMLEVEVNNDDITANRNL